MPRVVLKKDEYMVADFSKWLKGEMWSRNIRQEEMGNLLGISQQAFSNRMKNKNFSIRELILIFHEFGTPSEKIAQLLKY